MQYGWTKHGLPVPTGHPLIDGAVERLQAAENFNHLPSLILRRESE